MHTLNWSGWIAGEEGGLCTEEAPSSAAGEACFGASAQHSITLPAAEPLSAALLASDEALLPHFLRFEARFSLIIVSLTILFYLYLMVPQAQGFLLC